MFLGHYATGFAAKKISPRTPLPLLLLASQFIDHLWPIFILFGIERVAIVPGITVFTPLDFIYYPWTHSLLMSVAWGVGLGALVYAFRKEIREAVVIAALVPGHWLLDLLAHRPDLPLAPGTTTMFGLGLWNSVPATIAVELTLFAGGIVLYWRATPGASRRSRVVFGSLVTFLLLIYASNTFGPPPPSVEMIGVAGNALWIVILWAWWVEKRSRQ
ncbi:MAG: hypothetical protein MUE68_07380 [Bacteroidetes bacterium]|jgi:hypothetical protein|nr:hypothetical protein [Bacteroidota bacterium]